MASINRYENDKLVSAGKLLGTNAAIIKLRNAISAGTIQTTATVLRGAQRLDVIAHDSYGDGRLWWVIAAASGIGWWLQAPAGTRIVIPSDISAVLEVI